MKTIIATITFGLSCLLFTEIKGQQTNNLNLAIDSETYNTAIGLRAGETSGLTIKHFISNKTALEGIIGVWSHGFNATLLLEQHQQAFNVGGLNWYYGAGGHLSLAYRNTVWYNYRGDRYVRYYDQRMALGIDGIIGLEYKIPKAPFAISLDIKPYIEVVSNGNIWMGLDPGLGIKVTF
jgi:hypothetical protein